MPRHATVPGVRSVAAIAAFGSLVVGATAMAGPIPDVAFDLAVSDGTNQAILIPGMEIGTDLYLFQGDFANSNFELTYNFAGSADPTDADGAFLGSGFTVMNTSDQPLTFSLTLTLNLAAAALPQAQYAGSAGFALTGVDGSLTTGTSLFTGLIDGVAVESLFDNPFELSFAGQGSDDVSAAMVGGVNGPANTSIGYVMDFTLSPGDTVTTTGAFGILQVPGPAAGALFAVAAFASRRRRR